MTSKLDKCDKASPCINNIRLAPDGGYGWFIVLAYGTANVLIVPVLTSFGLIFKDKFQQLNMSALDATLILNLNSALGMTLGLFNGVLLKCFGYRKIAILGGSLFSGGLVATSFADSFQHFLITYSIITSIGMGLCTSSFSLALNSYFKERRNKAFGIGATITGIGPIFLPQLVSLLLAFYGTQGCVLIIGAIAMHIIAAALLLQPVKRYQKILRSEINSLFKATPSISGPSSINAQSKNLLEDFDNDENQYLDTCPIYHDIDQQSIYGFEITQHPVRKSEESIWSDLDYKFQTKTPIPVEHTQSVQYLRQRSGSVADTAVADAAIKSMSLPAKTRRWFESGSNASVNLESSWGIFHEDDHRPAAKAHSRWRLFEGEKGFLGRRASFMKMNLSQRRNTTVAIIAEHYVPKEPEKPLLVVVETPQAIESESPSIKIKRKSKRFQAIRIGWGRFVRVFDLGLLNDPIYLNMMFGISLAVFSEINFSLLTPFILDEFNYSTKEIAIFMSSLASADILCRFISPFIGDYFKQPPRIMYMYALFMLIVTRTCLLFAKSYQEILFVAIGLGIAKGVRSVYMSLVVPSYVPLERLAAASGIQMVANGILILMMGSFVGVFKDLFGSYSICIIFINCITFITLVLWTIELVIMKRKNVKRTQEMKGNEVLELCKFNIEVN